MELKLKLLIDVHTHLVNPGYNFKKRINSFSVNLMKKRYKFKSFDEYLTAFLKQLSNSKIDKAVLIGIENSSICAGNKHVLNICRKYPDKFLYGINLNPDDKDIEELIKQAASEKAVLVKILPSYQNIDLEKKKYIPFYEILKKYNLPLLIHTGIEHTLSSKNQELNNPKKLKNAAETGVKIICAHSGGRMFLHEKNYFNEWAELAANYENVYGDLSAMINPVQWFNLKAILKDAVLKNKVLFGTDYPAFPVMPLCKSSKNIFTDCCRYFEKMGFDNTIFINTEKILRL